MARSKEGTKREIGTEYLKCIANARAGAKKKKKSLDRIELLSRPCATPPEKNTKGEE